MNKNKLDWVNIAIGIISFICIILITYIIITSGEQGKATCKEFGADYLNRKGDDMKINDTIYFKCISVNNNTLIEKWVKER